ncbi:MAG TPA: DinB family protein [Candidatus Krumholzibacteria bacterium]|nr:DinB family protein [Candidatus Krumholzibacteria bacterium]
MTTADLLHDAHQRTHRGLARLLEQAAALDPSVLHREVEGFGYPTVQLQVHHLLGAEQYWVGVLEGEIRIDSAPESYPDIASLSVFRTQVAGATAAYLATGPDLDTQRTVTTWRGEPLELVPRHAVLRLITHAHHHLGQAQAMLRLMGHPVGALDFPLDP